MGSLLLVVIALIELALIVYLMLRASQNSGGAGRKAIIQIETEFAERDALHKQFEALYRQMVDLGTIRKLVQDYLSLQESLKAERGRITITQAELETVEARLRELEEIERELEASGLETKEELNILNKRRTELTARNETLHQQLSHSMEQMDALISEIEISSQLHQQIDTMKAELLQTQEKIDLLLQKVEVGNEQYYNLKKRYDALDIEYAQLYEKFSASEAAASSSGGAASS